MIVVNKINEVYFELDMTIEQSYDLRSMLSFRVPNCHFSPKYKAKQWDGTISFYDVRTGRLPIGLLPQFIDFCNKYHYEYRLNFDINTTMNIIDDTNMSNFYKSIFRSDFKLRDYQEGAIKAALQHKRGVIVLPTASGKSSVIYAIIRFILSQNKKIMLVVPNISLTTQMFSDFKDYGFDNAAAYCSVLYGKSDMYDANKPILITTWQSIQTKSPMYFKQFSCVIEDEAHGLGKGNVVQKILKSCTNAEYRIGLTGTLPAETIEQLTIFGYLGAEIYHKETVEMIDAGVISKIKIANMLLKYPKHIIDKLKGDYDAQVEFTITYPERNKILKYITDNIKQTDNVLILCQRIEHLKSMYEYLKSVYPNKKIYNIYGQTEAVVRDDIKKITEENDGVILVCSYGTMSTGVNIKKINHVIFASSIKSRIKVLQSIGRGLRLHSDKSLLVVWDIVDDMTYINRFKEISSNYEYKHWLERLQFYKQVGFKYISKSIDIDKI